MAVKKAKARTVPTSVRVYGKVQSELGVIKDDMVMATLVNALLAKHLKDFIKSDLETYAAPDECQRILNELGLSEDVTGTEPVSQEVEVPALETEV